MNTCVYISRSVTRGKSTENQPKKKIRLEITIERAQFDLLCQLGLIDPSRRKNGISRVVRQGLDYVIDKRWEVMKLAARKL